MELTDNDPHWAILGWVTGWLNVLGQFATTAFAADILAAHIASMFLIGNGHVFSNVEMLLAYAGQHLGFRVQGCTGTSVKLSSPHSKRSCGSAEGCLHTFAWLEHVDHPECPCGHAKPVSRQMAA